MNKKSRTPHLILSSILILTYTSPAYAYLDPATGSILLQGLLGGIAGAMVFLKIYWHKILSFFNIKKDTDKENED